MAPAVVNAYYSGSLNHIGEWKLKKFVRQSFSITQFVEYKRGVDGIKILTQTEKIVPQKMYMRM